jgi:hypothetical protein
MWMLSYGTVQLCPCLWLCLCLSLCLCFRLCGRLGLFSSRACMCVRGGGAKESQRTRGFHQERKKGEDRGMREGGVGGSG